MPGITRTTQWDDPRQRQQQNLQMLQGIGGLAQNIAGIAQASQQYKQNQFNMGLQEFKMGVETRDPKMLKNAFMKFESTEEDAGVLADTLLEKYAIDDQKQIRAFEAVGDLSQGFMKIPDKNGEYTIQQIPENAIPGLVAKNIVIAGMEDRIGAIPGLFKWLKDNRGFEALHQIDENMEVEEKRRLARAFGNELIDRPFYLEALNITNTYYDERKIKNYATEAGKTYSIEESTESRHDWLLAHLKEKHLGRGKLDSVEEELLYGGERAKEKFITTEKKEAQALATSKALEAKYRKEIEVKGKPKEPKVLGPEERAKKQADLLNVIAKVEDSASFIKDYDPEAASELIKRSTDLKATYDELYGKKFEKTEVIPEGLPENSKKIKTTGDGKEIWEAPNGKRYIIE